VVKDKGKKSHTLANRRTCSGFHSQSISSALELFQLSVLFLLGFAKRMEEPQDGVRGVRGEVAAEEKERVLGSFGCGSTMARAGSPGVRFTCMENKGRMRHQ
jgi:hypothetical protein